MSIPRASPHFAQLPEEHPFVPLSAGSSVRLAAVLAPLSKALDLSAGQPLGHAMRTCLLGMRIARETGANSQTRSDLFYALLLKDCGCSANASQTFHAFRSDDLKAKRDVKIVDTTKLSWETLQYLLDNTAYGKPFLERSAAIFGLARRKERQSREMIAIRSSRGAQLSESMGFSFEIATGIRNLDEHWNGAGQPNGFLGVEIPLLSRVILLAQTLEVFLLTHGPRSAIDVANSRSKRWFDPDLVAAVNSLNRRDALFRGLFSDDLPALCLQAEQEDRILQADPLQLDKICAAFAEIVDAKSPFTVSHSPGVARTAAAMADRLGLSPDRTRLLRRAALLHDLGKLGISNTILEKPARLDEGEWEKMKLHPLYTWEILHAVPGFDELSEIAGSHHERLDGSGYFRGLHGDHLCLESKILAVADTFEALCAKRPYRDRLSRENAFQRLWDVAPHQLDAACIEALECSSWETFPE